MTVNSFLLEPIMLLSQVYDVYIVLNVESNRSLQKLDGVAKIISINIQRKISLRSDFFALWQLFKLFRQYKFQVVHSVTPKAGLLAMLASFFSGIGVRVHTFTGQVWATKTGIKRWVFKKIDFLIGLLATNILVDSFSQRQFLISEKVISDNKSSVLAQGSIAGVNVHRFKPNLIIRSKIRRELNVSEDHIIILFLGRLNFDKGVLDLANAFNHLENNSVHLLFVGPDEGNIKSQILRIIDKKSDRVHFVEFTDSPESYMAAADLLCLPSYREGFGSVIIEAAAVGIPAVGSRIYGVIDAISEYESGLLFTPRNVLELQNCLNRLTVDTDYRIKLGKQAFDRAQKYFTSESVATSWLNYYQAKL